MAAPRSLTLLLGLSFAVVSCSPEANDFVPLDGASLDRIDDTISSWAEGRGWEWTVTRSDDRSSVSIAIEISPDANEIARAGYCEKLEQDIRSVLRRGQIVVLELLVRGRTVRECDV